MVLPPELVATDCQVCRGSARERGKHETEKEAMKQRYHNMIQKDSNGNWCECTGSISKAELWSLRVEVILRLDDIAIPLDAVGGCCCGSGQREGGNHESLSLLQVDICGVDLISWGVESVSAKCR